MLNSLIVLAEVMGADTSSVDLAHLTVAPAHAVSAFMAPEEPSTLALAVIGGGLIAAYAIVGRWRRSRQPGAIISKISNRPIHTDRNKRGAA
jgi:hypothetical protein